MPKDVLAKANNRFEQHNGHTASVPQFLTTPHNTMIATGLISKIVCTTELQNKPKVACTQLYRPFGVISSRFIPNFVLFAADHYAIVNRGELCHVNLTINVTHE